jgi:hypothetical protein
MKLNVNKLLGNNEQSDDGIDPAESSMNEAKALKQKMKQKKIGPIMKEDKWEDDDGLINQPYLETTEDNWTDEGGATSALSEEIEEIISYQRLAMLSMTKAYEPVHLLYEKYNNLLKELVELRDKKGKDYGTLEDPFANIRGAEEFGVKPWIGAANSANDCMVRIKQYARTGTLENESVRDSMLDLANYALITLVLWEENESNSEVV